MRRYKIEEVCKIVGIDDSVVTEFVTKEWIEPVAPHNNEFDDEDLARIKLILELINNLSVNEEAVPLVLHLIDQIHRLHIEIQNRNNG